MKSSDKTGSGSSIKSDASLWADVQDEFDYCDYSQALGRQLMTVELPFTLGIFGGWGQGKTSLMRLLRAYADKAEERHDDKLQPVKAHSVWFDAWKFDREESVWRALLAQTVDDLHRALQKKRESLANNSDELQSIDTFIEKTLLPLKEQLYRGFSQVDKSSITVDWSGLLKQLALFGMRNVLPGSGVFGRILNVFKPGARPASGYVADAGLKADIQAVEKLFGVLKREETYAYYEHIQHIEQFDRRFGELVENTLTLLGCERLIFLLMIWIVASHKKRLPYWRRLNCFWKPIELHLSSEWMMKLFRQA